MDIEMMPCPFCGESAMLDDGAMGHAIACCTQCGAAAGERPNDELAAAAWNTRAAIAAMPSHAEQAEQAEQAAELASLRAVAGQMAKGAEITLHCLTFCPDEQDVAEKGLRAIIATHAALSPPTDRAGGVQP